MITFENLVFTNHPNSSSGVQAIVKFDNGYGASVIKTQTSYGGQNGLYELAVLGKDDHITYDTPITDDVLGYLSKAEVTTLLAQIQSL